jgi:two-component system, OmpR family, phosphate regulon response regulator PhoB
MPTRILIVEDEEPLLELLRYNFECAGYAVDTLTDGNRVEASLETSVPDILIVDWMLPGLSGIELCWRLRRRPATKSVPLMMLTARREEHDRARAIKAGADDYMVKPFSVRDLIERVEALLTRAGSLRIESAGPDRHVAAEA